MMNLRAWALAGVFAVLLVHSLPRMPSRVTVRHELSTEHAWVHVDVNGLGALRPLDGRFVVELPSEFVLKLPTEFTGRVSGQVVLKEEK